MNWTDFFIYEDGKLLNKKTRHEYRNLDRDGYIRVRVLGLEYRAHRIIWEMLNSSKIPTDMIIDHIDRDVSNNRIENLRLATRKQNNHNSVVGIKNRELPKGVTVNPGGKYRARLTVDAKTYSLGTFNTSDEAHNAIVAKDLELKGEFSPYYRAS